MTGQNTPPRPGFTQALTEERAAAFPVVVGINHSGISALALRRAADEAAHRSARLHIVVGGDAQDALDSSVTDAREMSTIASILRNRHVTVSPVESASPEALLDYCAQVGASLLVIGCEADTDPQDLENPATAHRLVDEAECDVLVIHADEQHRHN